MKTFIITLLVVVVTAGLILVGCKSSQTSTKQGEAAISGFVKDSDTRIGLGGAVITASTLTQSLSATTNSDGSFANLTFNADSLAIVSVLVQKSGYNDTSFSVVIQSGSVLQLNILLSPKTSIIPGGGTGLANTIAFLGATPQEVRVYGVGAQETSILGWEVRDSLGFPIDAAHAVQLSFTLNGGPQGGEYVSPAVLLTNSIGRAFTTFNAGTRAGIVQVLAQANVGSRLISSSPVRVVIDAGFPVHSHFTIAAANYNFAAMHWLARTDVISVLLGDIYSNPVAPGTAVYFHTSPYPPADTAGGAGVIQPATWTNVNGQGTVNLISGNPLPLGQYADAVAGNAYHWVVGRTVGQGGTVVTDSILMMWSGYSRITNLSPDSTLLSVDGAGFHIPDGGCRTFTFTAADEFGHPLSAGTVISVVGTVPPPTTIGDQVNQIQLSFGINGSVTLPDVTAPGAYTNFSFDLCDGSAGFSSPTVVVVTISISSQNGNVTKTFRGIVN